MRIFVVTVAKRSSPGAATSPDVGGRINQALSDPVWLIRDADRRESWVSPSGAVRIDAVSNEPPSTGPLIQQYASGNAATWTGHIDDPSFVADRPDPDTVANLPGCFALAAATDDGVDGFTCVHRIEPLYLAEGADVYVLSSRARTAHMAAGIIERVPPIDALLGLTGAGYMVNDATTYPGVTAVPADSQLSVRPTGTRVWSLPGLDIDPSTPPEDLAHRLAEAMVTAAAALGRGPTPLVQLTGGKDSRLAAVVLAAAGVDYTTLTYGHESHPDVVVAAQVATMLGVPHAVKPLQSTGTDGVVRATPTSIAYHTLRGCEGMLTAYETPRVSGRYNPENLTVSSAAAEIVRGGWPFGFQADSFRVVTTRFLDHVAPHHKLLSPDGQARMDEIVEPWLEMLRIDANRASMRYSLGQWAGRWYGVERAAHGIGSPVRGIQVDNQVARLAAVVDPAVAAEGRFAHAAIHRLRPDLCAVPYVGSRWRFEASGPSPYCDPDTWAERAPVSRRSVTAWSWRDSYPEDLHRHFAETILSAPLFDRLLDRGATENFLSGAERPDRSYLHVRLSWAIYTAGQLLAGLGSDNSVPDAPVFTMSIPEAVRNAAPDAVEASRRPQRRPSVDGPELTQCNLCDEIFARDKGHRLCPSCGLGPEHRGLRHVLDNYGNVFHGRSVLALGASGSAPRDLLWSAADLQLLAWTGQDSDETILRPVADSTHDAVAIFTPPAPATTLTLVTDAARILRPGGVLVGVEPATRDAGREDSDVAPARSVRLAQLAEDAGLTVTIFPGFDPVLRETPLVVLAYRTSR